MNMFLFRHQIFFIMIFLSSFLIMGCGLRYSIKGRVVDARTGDPIGGAVVAIKWYHYKMGPPYSSGYEEIERAEAMSDKDGFFWIPRYLNKEYDIGAYKDGYVCWSGSHIFQKGKNKMIMHRKEVIKVEYGMVIELESFEEGYSRERHACFVVTIDTHCSNDSAGMFTKATVNQTKMCREYLRGR